MLSPTSFLFPLTHVTGANIILGEHTQETVHSLTLPKEAPLPRHTAALWRPL